MASPTSAYTTEQISVYLELINLPKRFWPAANPPLDLELLTALHVHSISTVPYENLSLHYSPSREISLEPQRIYEKFMRNGRGGYCFEHGIFFNNILGAFGFSAYMTGVRIRLRVDGEPIGDYTGWRHVVNIVILVDGSKYMLDVGFGGDGPIQPLPLIHERVTQNIGSQQLRLLHGFIPAQTTGADESKKLWIYQYRNGDDRQWNSFYAFPEIQFFPQDLAMLNFYISRSPESLQTNRVLIVKFLRRNHQLDCSPLAIIYGKVMLVNGDVKLNTGGRTAVVKSCKTEDERVEALKEYFGITLTNEERQSINGTPTALGQLYFIS